MKAYRCTGEGEVVAAKKSDRRKGDRNENEKHLILQKKKGKIILREEDRLENLMKEARKEEKGGV